MVTITLVRDRLPPGFEILRHAAEDEAFGMLKTLAEEWQAGNRFDQPGEALVAATDGEVLAGMGAMTLDPHIPGALRMRRFYVRPAYRRHGIARRMADWLLGRPEVAGKLITLNAPRLEAARFWEALGFMRDAKDGHTHVRRGDFTHA